MGGEVNFSAAGIHVQNDTTKFSVRAAAIGLAFMRESIMEITKSLVSTPSQVEEQDTPREIKMFSDKEPDFEASGMPDYSGTTHYSGEVPYSTQEPEENVYMLDMRPDGKPVFLYQTADAYEIPDGVNPKDVYSAVRDFNGFDKNSYPPSEIALPEVLTVTKDGQTFEIRRKEEFQIKGNDINYSGTTHYSGEVPYSFRNDL